MSEGPAASATPRKGICFLFKYIMIITMEVMSPPKNVNPSPLNKEPMGSAKKKEGVFQ
jgi:hypothetical protein